MAELLGERIKRLREAREMTASDLAREMGVSRQCVDKWEAYGNPRLDRLKKLCRVLKTTPNDLLAGY